MAGWEMKLIEAEARRLIALAAGDDDLRAGLRALAEEILAATGGPRQHAEPAPAMPSSEAMPPEVAGEALPQEPGRTEGCTGTRPQEPEPLHELTLGRRGPTANETLPSEAATTRPEAGDDLSALGARCRAKAGAARRAAGQIRQTCQGIDAQAEDAPTAPEIAAWEGTLTDCFYWLNAPDTSQPADPSLLDDVGGCFEAVGEALALVAGCEGRRGCIERVLPVLAEAQSMLRRALQRLQAPDDPDQLAAYEWVRRTAARHRIYLRRSMRADDQAAPSRWPDLLDRIERLAGGDPQTRQHRSLLDRVRQRLGIIRQGRGTDQDWQEIIRAVDDMIDDGMPPSDRQVRDLLLPVLDGLPDRDDLPTGFRLVLREIDRYLATTTAEPEAAAVPGPTAEVEEAARLLGGRSVVLIGGDRRPVAQHALEEALGVEDVIWIETKEHQPVASFESAIARPEVALVLLAIRWSSHSFGEVRLLCDRHGKPLIRLPGGYNPNQVAAQILSQAGERLRGG